ncbi:dipeptidyl peptidase 4-like [Liolophura sinensis]|uniref:dipeptidyl peptidase 4-like n=1 Tax=Liolophura sinensis TaxID=3198878 RepID=UPI003158640C
MVSDCGYPGHIVRIVTLGVGDVAGPCWLCVCGCVETADGAEESNSGSCLTNIEFTAVILVSPPDFEEDYGEQFTLDEFFSSDYKPKDFTVEWIPGEDKFIYRNDDGAIMEYDAAHNSSKLIIDNSTFIQLDSYKYSVSNDRKYVLIAYDVMHNYRHTFHASYLIYEVATRVKRHLQNAEYLQYAEWSPRGHGLVFVEGNNLFYQKEVDGSPQAITTDGLPEEIFNGIPDWIYEEEILSSDHAFWWSTHGTYLCYAVFNDTMVPKYSYPVYGKMANVYGDIKRIAYPKPGYANPKFSLKVVKIGDPLGMPVTLMVPPEFADKDHYFTAVSWRDDNYVMVLWLNRPQNYSIITVCSAVTGQCNKNLEEYGHGGWLELFAPPLYSDDGNKYFIILPQRYAGAGYYKHVAMVTSSVSPQMGEKTFLTQGTWEVLEIVGYDSQAQLVYYLGTGGDSRKKHLYSVGIPNTNRFRKIVCLSCNVSPNCQYVSASFSSTGKYFILGCEGPGVPYYMLRSIVNNTMTVLEDNAGLRERISYKAMPRKEYFEIELEDGSVTWGELYLPAKLKKEEVLKYPLLVYVYGGPGSQRVTEHFQIGWETYLSSSLDIIYGAVDGRGTGGKGDNFLHKVYRRLGKVEIDDQITAGKLFSELHYVDSSRTAIWGLSYGGFVSAHVLGRGTDVFKCGISVAPVTDWRYYDSVYTERYMGTPKPEDNFIAYKESNVCNLAKEFKKSSFLLIHGTGDDNVHFQHSAQLIRALTEEDIYFRLQIYTDENHFLNGGHTRRHLYETMQDFLEECFTGKSKKFDAREEEKVSNKQEDITE